MSRLEDLARELPHFLRSASLLEIEAMLRALAVELHERPVPDPYRLFDYARVLERVRVHLRTALAAHDAAAVRRFAAEARAEPPAEEV